MPLAVSPAKSSTRSGATVTRTWPYRPRGRMPLVRTSRQAPLQKAKVSDDTVCSASRAYARVGQVANRLRSSVQEAQRHMTKDAVREQERLVPRAVVRYGKAGQIISGEGEPQVPGCVKYPGVVEAPLRGVQAAEQQQLAAWQLRQLCEVSSRRLCTPRRRHLQPLP